MAALLHGPYGKHILPEGYSVLGRSPECDIHLDDPRLSRRHARFYWHAGSLMIEDLDSQNGILVNGEIVKGNSNLFNGNMIAIGPAVYDIIIDDSIPTQSRNVATEIATKHGSTHSYRAERDTEGMASDNELPLPLTGPHERDLSHGTSTKHALTERKHSHSNDDPFNKDPRLADTLADGLVQSNKIGTSERFKPSNSSVKNIETSLVEALLPNQSEDESDDDTSDFQAVQAAEKLQVEALNKLLPKDSGVQQFRYTAHSKIFGVVRICAGFLDGLQNTIVLAMICLPIMIAGYVTALLQSHVSIYNGLPTLDFQHEDGNWIAIIESLFSVEGWERAYKLCHEIYEIFPDSFIWIFSALTLSFLVATLFLLLSLTAATTIKGAPFWHRRFGLVILERKNGFYPTPLRSSLRWLLGVLLMPISLVFALFNARGLHDILSGCEVKTSNEHQ